MGVFQQLSTVICEGITQPRVTFAKSVVLENPRLARIYQVLMLITAAFIALKMIFLDTFLQLSDVSGSVKLSVEGVWHEEALAEQQLSATDLDVCVNPRSYDYAWGENWYYVNNTCGSLCSAGDTARFDENACWTVFDAFHEDETSVFFVTYAQSLPVVPGASLSSQLHHQRGTFLPFVDALSLSMTIGRIFGIRDSVDSALPHIESVSANPRLGSPLIILRKDEQPWRAFAPGEKFVLLMSEVLEVAGVSLDVISSKAGPNQLDPTAFPDTDLNGPLLRMAGVELTVEVRSYNWHRYDFSSVYTGDAESVCYVDIVASDVDWVSRTTIDFLSAGEKGLTGPMSGARLFSTHYGVKVGYRMVGVHRQFDVSFFFVTLMGGFVLLRFPSYVVMFVAMFGLGRLSKIYHRVIRERVNLQDQCAQMAVKMMQLSATFQELSAKHGSVQMCDVRDRLHDVLKYRGDLLDEDEIEHFIHYVFKIFINESSWARGNKTLKRSQSGAVIDSRSLDSYGLASACLKAEKFDLDTLVSLFDRNRFVEKHGCITSLEELFMERGVHHAIMDSSRAKTDHHWSPKSMVRDTARRLSGRAADVMSPSMSEAMPTDSGPAAAESEVPPAPERSSACEPAAVSSSCTGGSRLVPREPTGSRSGFSLEQRVVALEQALAGLSCQYSGTPRSGSAAAGMAVDWAPPLQAGEAHDALLAAVGRLNVKRGAPLEQALCAGTAEQTAKLEALDAECLSLDVRLQAFESRLSSLHLTVARLERGQSGFRLEPHLANVLLQPRTWSAPASAPEWSLPMSGSPSQRRAPSPAETATGAMSDLLAVAQTARSSPPMSTVDCSWSSPPLVSGVMI